MVDKGSASFPKIFTTMRVQHLTLLVSTYQIQQNDFGGIIYNSANSILGVNYYWVHRSRWSRASSITLSILMAIGFCDFHLVSAGAYSWIFQCTLFQLLRRFPFHWTHRCFVIHKFSFQRSTMFLGSQRLQYACLNVCLWACKQNVLHQVLCLHDSFRIALQMCDRGICLFKTVVYKNLRLKDTVPLREARRCISQ